jgi:hypothetical protein
VCSEVHYIIHCAADIRFTLSLVESLRANYIPTRSLLELAAEAPKLRCFTYVSTAYVNSDLPKGQTVKEMLYSDAVSRATKKETDDTTRARVLSLLLTVEKKKGDSQVRTPLADNAHACHFDACATSVCLFLLAAVSALSSKTPLTGGMKPFAG